MLGQFGGNSRVSYLPDLPWMVLYLRLRGASVTLACIPLVSCSVINLGSESITAGEGSDSISAPMEYQQSLEFQLHFTVLIGWFTIKFAH